MTPTTLDAAIEAALAQTGFPDGPPTEHNRTYARALIAKLLEGMDRPEREQRHGYNAALTEIRRRAGIEGDKV
jgi:hypothetical protein